jgi:hypothetical protein
VGPRLRALDGGAVVHAVLPRHGVGLDKHVLEQGQASRPAETVLAADLVSEPQGERALEGVCGEQRGPRLEALGEEEDLGPVAAGPLVFVHRDRRPRLPRPGQEPLVVLARALAHRRVGNPLHPEDALGCLAPGARHACGEHEPQPGLLDGFVDLDVLHVSLTRSGARRCRLAAGSGAGSRPAP